MIIGIVRVVLMDDNKLNKFKVGDEVLVPCPVIEGSYHKAKIMKVTTLDGKTYHFLVRFPSKMEMFVVGSELVGLDN